MTVSETIRELATYALSKKGAQLEYGGELSEDITKPCVKLPGISWGDFFEVENQDGFQPVLDGTFAELPVYADRLVEHQKKCPAIRKTEWMERDGHIQMAVPLDANLPVELLKSLIDEAYDLIWNKLDDHQRFRIERASAPFDNVELLNELIDLYNLTEHRKEVHEIVRRAILLRTKPSTEADIPLGATKLGGIPDLPSTAQWPVYQDGKPLAFLGQIDLSDIAVCGTIVDGLPSQGTLSVFSVWGWVSEDEPDPQTPDSGWKDQDGWTVVLHSAPAQKLTRRQTPEGVNSFAAAAALPILILSTPNHRVEPPLAALNWSDDEYERFDKMQSDYRSIQMAYWLKNMDNFASHHLLGGYALFQQQFPEELLQMNSTMLLQIGTDNHTWMGWGDGGELTFYSDTDALRKGRFERLWGECQGG